MWIVSAELIFFELGNCRKFKYLPQISIFYLINWIFAAKNIQGRKLFKGRNYMREIWYIYSADHQWCFEPMNICIGSTCQYRTVVPSEISFKVNLFHNYKKVICRKVSCSDLLPVVLYAWFVGSRYHGHFISAIFISTRIFNKKYISFVFYSK